LLSNNAALVEATFSSGHVAAGLVLMGLAANDPSISNYLM
jgi:hypothetical protein